MATFSQTGGTNIISSELRLGYDSGSTSGTYNLSGTGQLSAGSEYIGYQGTGTFMQTGGTNTATFIMIGVLGTYTLNGGTLNLNGGINNYGIWDLSNSSAIINVSSSFLNLSGANLINAGNSSLYLDAHSLLLIPSGFDPANCFKNYSNAGILHQVGSILDISSNYSIYGIGSINDHVFCQGTLSATSGYSINLSGGLTVSGSGTVNLGKGYLYVYDAFSWMDGGSLSADSLRVDSTRAGTFTQTGGTISIASYLDLGNNSGSSGTYNLGGTGQLSANDEHIGISGTGAFMQTSGTNSISSDLYLGYSSGSTGTYYLGGTGQLTANYEYIGDYGNGTFTQTGGTNSISSYLYIGTNSGSTGTYNLNGGTLILKALTKGSGTSVFNFGGGTLQASGAFTSSLPMTLTGINGNANIDTMGYAVTLSGLLSGTGGLDKLGSGTLTLSSNESYAGNTTVRGGTLIFSGGIGTGGTSFIDVQSGTLVLKTTNVNKDNLNVTTAELATFEVVNGTHVVGAIAGSGITKVDSGVNLTAASVNQAIVTLGIGARVTIQPIPGGPSAGNITPVPEPSTIGLLAMSFLCMFAKRFYNFKRHLPGFHI